MPYTLSHAIAAAPIWELTGKRLPLASLIIGSWAPDIPYMFSLAPIDAPGHAPLEIFTHCLPLAMIAIVVWYHWLEKPISTLFGFQQRGSNLGYMRLYASSALGIVLGAASHVLWDATSHSTGWFVVNSNTLQNTTLWFPNYKWVQYSGGLLGLFGLAVWYMVFVSRSACNNQGSRDQRKRFLKICLATVSAFVALANLMNPATSYKSYLVHSMAGTFTGGIISLIIYATVENVKPTLGKVITKPGGNAT